MTIEELLASRDWAEVFAEVNSGNVSNHVEAIGTCRDDSVTRLDVKEIIALHDTTDQEWDGWRGAGVFLLKDGRYLFAEGSCDYTGWD